MPYPTAETLSHGVRYSAGSLTQPLTPTAGRGLLSVGGLFALSMLLTAMFFVSTQKLNASSNDNFGRLKGRQALAKMEGGSIGRRAGFALLGALGAVYLLANSPISIRPHRLVATGVMLYIGWSLISVMWSVEPLISIRRLTLMSCFMLGAAGVARQTRPRDLLFISMAGCLACLLIGIGAELALGTFRPWAGNYRFSGTMQPNIQGMNCSVLAFAGLGLFRLGGRRKWVYFGVMVLALVMLILTKSRSAAGAGLFSLMIVCIFSGQLGRNLALICFLIWGGGLFYITVGDSLMHDAGQAAQMGREDSEVSSLTGRLPLWTTLLGYVSERPLLGHGYGGFWIPAHVDEIIRSQGWVATSAHSAYLECLLDTGIPGFCFYVLMLFSALGVSLVRHLRDSNPVWGFFACILLYCALQGAVETAMATLPQLATLMVFIALMHMAFGTSDELAAAAEPEPGRAGGVRPVDSRFVWSS